MCGALNKILDNLKVPPGADCAEAENINGGGSPPQKKERGNMALGGCGSQTEEKIGRLDERNSSARNAVIVCGVVIVAMLAISWGMNNRVGDIKGDVRELRTETRVNQREVQELKAELRRMSVQLEDAKKAYGTARSYVSRYGKR